MKYFIYTRKSTDSEERQVMSLESQLSELKEFAAKPFDATQGREELVDSPSTSAISLVPNG